MTSSEPGRPELGRPERAWRLGAQAPAGFVPERIVAQPDGSGLMFGWRGGPGPVDRVGVILRVYADGGLRTVWEGPGWVRAGDLLDGAGFAVVGHPGPRFTLLRAVSVDVGGWVELGEIPAQSVTSALIMGPDEVWLLGADTLIRWKAGEFEAKSAPGRRDSTRDRLFRVGDQLVLGTPEGLFLSRDDGQRWGHRNVDGAHVRALAFPYLAAVQDGRVRLGRLEGAFVEWLGDVTDPGDPLSMGWTARPLGAAMQLALVPDDPAAHPGLAIAASHPDGGFVTSLLALPPNESWLGVAGDKGALALTETRRVLQAGRA